MIVSDPMPALAVIFVLLDRANRDCLYSPDSKRAHSSIG